MLKVINHSCSSYPIRASYSGQVDRLVNPMKNDFQTTAVFEKISNRDANLLWHIDKTRNTQHITINSFI